MLTETKEQIRSMKKHQSNFSLVLRQTFPFGLTQAHHVWLQKVLFPIEDEVAVTSHSEMRISNYSFRGLSQKPADVIVSCGVSQLISRVNSDDFQPLKGLHDLIIDVAQFSLTK